MSATEFFAIMALYNSAVWPVTILSYILGVVAFFFAFRKTSVSDQVISLILAFLWLWVGIVFGLIYYGSWTAIAFGIPIPGFGLMYTFLFSLQGIIFLFFGVYRKSLSFKFSRDIYSLIGLIFILFSLIFYPLVGFASGYPFPFYPVFGTSPCPVAIFTVGLFFFADKRISPLALIIPVIYGFMGLIPVIAFGIFADVGLFVAGIFGVLLLYKHWKWPQDSET